MSTIEADAVTAATGTNTALSLRGKGTGKVALGDATLLWPDADGGSSGDVLQTNGSGTLSFATPGGGLTLGTMQTPTGTVATFSGIPSGTKRITINMAGISLDATASSYLRLRIGDAGGIELGGYLGQVARVNATDTDCESHYNDFELTVYAAHAALSYGTVVLTLMNAATFQWACSSVLGRDPSNAVNISGGTKTLSAELTQLDLASGGGSGNFDAGTINITYE